MQSMRGPVAPDTISTNLSILKTRGIKHWEHSQPFVPAIESAHDPASRNAGTVSYRAHHLPLHQPPTVLKTKEP